MRRRPASLCAMLLAAGFFGACQNHSKKPKERPVAGSNRQGADSEVNLGTIVRGGEQGGSFRFSNMTDEFVEVRRWQTSCECVRVTSRAVDLAPGQAAEITVIGHFPPEAQPGRMRVEVEGLDVSDAVVLKFDAVMRLTDDAAVQPAEGSTARREK